MPRKYVFDGYDNPSAKTLLAVDPTFEVPADYNGYNDTPDLARAVLTLVQRGRAFADVTREGRGNVYQTRLHGLPGFSALFERFGAPAAESLYYTLLPNLTQNPEDEGDAWYYLLNLAIHYGEAVTAQVTTVQTIVGLDYAQGDEPPSPDLLERLTDLNGRLRREGVVFDMEELYICVERIDADELLGALAANFTPDHIIPLVRVGLVTAEQIIAHRDDLPVDWLNMLLGEVQAPTA